MTILATAYGTLTVVNTTTPVALIDLEVTDADGFEIDLTVTGAAAVAAAQRFQRVGARIDYDRGDGAMVTFPDREIGNELTIDESTDSYGDRLSLQLVGERFSPFDGRALLRAKRQVDAHLWYGSPLNEYLSKVFTGWVVEGPYDVQPPTSRVTCLDAAALYTEKRAKDWSLPPNSGRTRLSVTLELLALGGIPVGHIELPFGHGGIVRKPRALGDRTILDFLRDWLGAIGVEIGFEAGAFVARRYDPLLPPVLELHAGNLALPITLTPPPTLAPNVSGVVSVSYNRVEPTGERSVRTSVVTVGPYAVQTKDGPMAARTMVTGEIITDTTYLGSLDVLTEQTEKSWYAPRASPDHLELHVDPPGYEVVPNTAGSFVPWSDGTTRRHDQEAFQITRRMSRRKTPDADGNVINVREDRYFLHFVRRAVTVIESDGDEVLAGSAIFLTDDGQGVVAPYEIMGFDMLPGGGAWFEGVRPDESDATTFTLNDDGTIREERRTELRYDIGSERRRDVGAYGYGVDSRTYTGQQFETFDGGKRVTITTYRAIDEDRYEVVRVVRDGTLPPVTTTETFTGSPPRPERVEATSTSQEIRATIRDEQRIGFAGEEIEDVEHNEFIETPEEARALAVWKAMQAGAVVLDCTIPIEGQVHKWRMVTVNLPGSSIHGLKFYVRSVQRNVATFLERIVGHYYPPQIS